jgi:hypothetical protein
VRKFPLNLASGEPLTLVQKFPYLDNPIKLDPLLESALELCVHYLIIGCMLRVVKVEICSCQLLFDL